MYIDILLKTHVVADVGPVSTAYLMVDGHASGEPLATESASVFSDTMKALTALPEIEQGTRVRFWSGGIPALIIEDTIERPLEDTPTMPSKKPRKAPRAAEEILATIPAENPEGQPEATAAIE